MIAPCRCIVHLPAMTPPLVERESSMIQSQHRQSGVAMLLILTFCSLAIGETAEQKQKEPNQVQRPVDFSAAIAAAQLALQGEAHRSSLLLLSAAELALDLKEGDRD